MLIAGIPGLQKPKLSVAYFHKAAQTQVRCLKSFPASSQTYSLIDSLLGQCVRDTTVKSCCMLSRKGNVLGEVVWKEFDHVSVPITVQ
jgi:hypothetical protein